MKKHKNVIYAILVIIILSIVERYTNYWPKSLIKLLLMALIPILAFKSKPKMKNYKISKESKILILLMLILMPLVFHFIKGYIDLNQIRVQLKETMGIQKNNFFFVAIYISLINSFVEEYFFRSYLYLQEPHQQNNIISASLFSIYHLSIMGTWTDPMILMLSLLGLFIVGIVFNHLAKKTDSIFNSWIVHIIANIMINSIAYLYIL